MTLRSILTPILAATLLAAPVAAEAARTPTPPLQSEGIEGDNTWIWVGLGVAALVLIIILADDNDNHDHPASP